MKRYALVPVIGTGTESDPWRPKVPEGLSYSAVIPARADGSPALPWGLVIVAASDLAALDEDVDLDAFPHVPLSTRLGDLPATWRQRIRAALERRGVDTSQATANNTVGDLLRYIGRHLDGNFTLEYLDVRE